MTNNNHRCSGGDKRGQMPSKAIECAQQGWDDREVVETVGMADEGEVEEEELSTHF